MKIDESMQALIDAANDPNVSEENKYIMFRQGFISGALSVLIAQENTADFSDKQVIDAVAKDLTTASVEHYGKFKDTIKKKGSISKAQKLVKEFYK